MRPLALFALAAACGSDYWVARDARPSPSGWVAARRDDDGAAVAVRLDELRQDRTRIDGARRMTRRFRNSNALAAGFALVGCGTVLAAVGIAFAALAARFVDNRGFNDDVAMGFGIPGAIMVAGGAPLIWLGWPIHEHAEPLAAHPEVGAVVPTSDVPPAP